jgi:hypothetical protein
VGTRIKPMEDTDAGHAEDDTVADCDVDAARALIFGDSMVANPSSFLINSFARFRWTWGYPSLQDVQRYVELEHPDFVIEERIERNLTLVPPPSPPPVVLVSSAPPADAAGSVDALTPGDKTLVLYGWGRWQPALGGSRLRVNTNLPIERTKIAVVPRLDVAKDTGDSRLAESGFILTLYLDETKPQPEKNVICLWTDDPVYGTKRISDWAKCREDDARLVVTR